MTLSWGRPRAVRRWQVVRLRLHRAVSPFRDIEESYDTDSYRTGGPFFLKREVTCVPRIFTVIVPVQETDDGSGVSCVDL